MQILNLDRNALYLLLGKLLDPKTDWKVLLAKEGAAVAKEKLRGLWHERLEGVAKEIADDMTGEGWSWAAAQDADFLAKQKVQIAATDPTDPGFIISRDALFALFRETGVPGGLLRDTLRDAYDNAVYLDALATYGEPFSAETPLLVYVELTRDALIDTVL